MAERLMTCTDVAALQNSMSRKFEVSDVTEALWQSAMHYARTYRGGFTYMINMNTTAKKRALSNAQAKGVLNCMAAEGRKQLAEAAPVVEELPVAIAINPVPNGIFSVNGVILRIEDITFGDFAEGTRVIKYKKSNGGDGDRVWDGFATLHTDGRLQVWRSRQWAKDQEAAAKALLRSGDPLSFGFAYSLFSGKCFVCNTALDDPISVKAGIGPVCAKRIGIKRDGLSMEERAAAATIELVETFA